MHLGTPQNMTADPLAADAVTPQLFTVEDIKPEKIPPGENEEFVCVSPLQWSFQVQINGGPMWALNGGITLLLTLDQPENVVKRNDALGQPTQSISFQLSSIVGRLRPDNPG